MRALEKRIRLLVFSALLLSGCKEITKSVNDTLRPSRAAVERNSKDTPVNTTTNTKTSITTTTSSTHTSDQQVIVNGDTLNTAEIDDKTKVLFKDLEELQKNKTPGNSKEIQQKVNEFIKDINLKQQKGHGIPAAVAAKESRSFFLTIAQLEKAEMQLRDLPQYAGKEIMVYQAIHFDEDGRIRLMLQHPEHPKFIDAYIYENGKWSVPKPVQVVNRDITRRLMPLDKISFPCATLVLKQYNEKAAQIAGAKPTDYVYISIWDDRIRWFPGTINGTRERYSIDFNTNGTLKSFRQD